MRPKATEVSSLDEFLIATRLPDDEPLKQVWKQVKQRQEEARVSATYALTVGQAIGRKMPSRGTSEQQGDDGGKSPPSAAPAPARGWGCLQQPRPRGRLTPAQADALVHLFLLERQEENGVDPQDGEKDHARRDGRRRCDVRSHRILLDAADGAVEAAPAG